MVECVRMLEGQCVWPGANQMSSGVFPHGTVFRFFNWG